MKTKTLYFFLCCFSLLIFIIQGKAQSLYVPTTINSPLFSKGMEKENKRGTLINNYGLHFNYSGVLKRKILIVGMQCNGGGLKFDPLNFNKYFFEGQESHLIASYPTSTIYAEFGLGYNAKLNSQKLSFITGAGHDIINKNTRYFLQIDWGNESKLINAGVSARANYAVLENNHLFVLEHVIQGKVKVWEFYIVNQFGYAIAIKKGHDYMKPILSIGLEFTP